MSINPDYEHVLLEIRRHLHDPRGRKAAVMVGAGFSRNARHRSDSRKTLPDWSELTAGLASRLYIDPAERKKVLAKAGATSSAARLAQEFEVAFGRIELVAFIRELIRDDDFVPSELHQSLLELPWTDVFTTNYDRLLENAARSLWKEYYELVSRANDLPLVRRPRIIKLHGTLPDLEHLVLTEDDYRTYPRKFAPFVAAVQASLTENLLCLVGFSGDDPNFLAWAGWLRDEMQAAAPSAYFFTGSGLKPFQRSLLEARHIIPVPLNELFPAEDFSYRGAYVQLMKTLAIPPDSPSPAWNAGTRYANSYFDSNVTEEPPWPNGSDWVDVALLWRFHRRQYKGWCVLHREGAKRLLENTEAWLSHLSGAAIAEWPATTALIYLREIVWRWSTAQQPLPDNIVFEVIDQQIARFEEWRKTAHDESYVAQGKSTSAEITLAELDEAFRSLLEECFRHSREIGDDARFAAIQNRLEGLHNSAGLSVTDDAASFIFYQRALQSIGRLRHATARNLLESWDTRHCDPIWAVRRAGLCLECGLTSLGVRLLENALERIRSIPASIGINIRNMSMEGLALDLIWAAKSAHDNLPARPLPRRHVAQQRASTDRDLEMSGESPSAGESLKIDPPRQSEPPYNANDAQPMPERRQILHRLGVLGEYGCDPNDLQEWLELATSPPPQKASTVRREGFDIGSVIERNFFGGVNRQFRAAYQAVRFIEDAGLPLKVPGIITTTIAETLFRSSMKTIGCFAPHEAAGLFLRSREVGLVDDVMSRECLAKLSRPQFGSMFQAGIEGLRESLAHMTTPPPQREREDTFWDEQAGLACALIGHVAVCLQSAELCKLVREIAPLQHDERMLNRLATQGRLSTCIRRALTSLDKPSLKELLPFLLAMPVRGSKQLPGPPDQYNEWYDPVEIVGDFVWKADETLAADCGQIVDDMLVRIASAMSNERTNLCVRAACLMHSQLLTEAQTNKLSSSLFARVDPHGLPADTGCLDSLILSLPKCPGFDEVNAFREKHLTDASKKTNWRDLLRTHTPARQFRRTAPRDLAWSSNDLSMILDRADSWLEKERSPESSTPLANHPLAELHATNKNREVEFRNWLGTLENVILLNPNAAMPQWETANRIIQLANDYHWCVSQAFPSRVLRGFVSADQAVSEIRRRLGDRNSTNVLQACNAIVRWYELSRTECLVVPDELRQMLTALITSRRHESLSLLISSCMNIIERADMEVQAEILDGIGSGLEMLLVETAYDASEAVSPFSIGMKLRIRVACGRLAVRSASHGLSSAILDRWVAEIRSDRFGDVRREVSYEPSLPSYISQRQ